MKSDYIYCDQTYLGCRTKLQTPCRQGDAMPRIGDDIVDVVRALGVGLFGVGFAMEVMAPVKTS
jgi:hypothetical protein